MGQAAGEGEQVAHGLVGDLGAVGALHVGQDDVAFEELGHLHQVLDAGAGLLDPPQRLARADDGLREEPVARVGIDDLRDRLFFVLALDELHAKVRLLSDQRALRASSRG